MQWKYKQGILLLILEKYQLLILGRGFNVDIETLATT